MESMKKMKKYPRFVNLRLHKMLHTPALTSIRGTNYRALLMIMRMLKKHYVKGWVGTTTTGFVYSYKNSKLRYHYLTPFNNSKDDKKRHNLQK